MPIIGTTNSILKTGIRVYNPPNTITGQKTVAATGTAEVLTAASNQLTVGLTVKALASNTNPVFVGNSTVSTAVGFELSAGEQIFIPITDTATIYVDVTTNGEGVSYIGN
jgi:DNA-binding phage protein